MFSARAGIRAIFLRLLCSGSVMGGEKRPAGDREILGAGAAAKSGCVLQPAAIASVQTYAAGQTGLPSLLAQRIEQNMASASSSFI